MSCWNIATNNWRIYYQNLQDQAQVFLSLCEDRNGNIWAGTYSSGVYLIDGKSGREIDHYSSEKQNSNLTNDYIFDIYKDSHGDLWMGAH